MKLPLLAEAIAKYVTGVMMTGLLLFVPAGTAAWTNGWLFMAILFIPMLIGGTVMYVKDPELLEKRLEGREKEKEQRIMIALSGLMFMVGFLLCGFGHRFGWAEFPRTVTIIFSVLFLMAYALLGEVIRENRWLSRTIKVDDGQEVVSTGLYGIVRHPMYSATLLMFLSMPIVLGSPYAFMLYLTYPFLIAYRIRNEEKVLERELAGYSEYIEKVRYRLMPFIW